MYGFYTLVYVVSEATRNSLDNKFQNFSGGAPKDPPPLVCVVIVIL